MLTPAPVPFRGESGLTITGGGIGPVGTPVPSCAVSSEVVTKAGPSPGMAGDGAGAASVGVFRAGVASSPPGTSSFCYAWFSSAGSQSTPRRLASPVAGKLELRGGDLDATKSASRVITFLPLAGRSFLISFSFSPVRPAAGLVSALVSSVAKASGAGGADGGGVFAGIFFCLPAKLDFCLLR